MVGLKLAICWLLLFGLWWFPSATQAECPADLSGDNVVNGADLAQLLGAWGSNPGSPADINGDSIVNAGDLAQLLGVWGLCPLLGMVVVPGGAYEMGCEEFMGCPSSALPVHTVLISSFYLSILEVTNEQYAGFLNSAFSEGQIDVIDGTVYKAAGNEPYGQTILGDAVSRILWNGKTFGVLGDHLPDGDPGNKTMHPMITVSWYGAAAYCNWRSVQDGLDPCYDLTVWTCDYKQNGYRMPTEAEWEYAARGGLHDPYYAYPWGADLDGSKANYSESGDPWEAVGVHPFTSPVGYYDGGQIPVGVDMVNGYGLYDMVGGVREWCNDWWDEDYYSVSPYDNPQGPADGSFRVHRGGGWNTHGDNITCSKRSATIQHALYRDNGFRIAARSKALP